MEGLILQPAQQACFKYMDVCQCNGFFCFLNLANFYQGGEKFAQITVHELRTTLIQF